MGDEHAGDEVLCFVEPMRAENIGARRHGVGEEFLIDTCDVHAAQASWRRAIHLARLFDKRGVTQATLPPEGVYRPHLTAGAYALRQAAAEAVAGGASRCLVMAAWAPNVGEPLDVVWQLEGCGPRRPDAWFAHRAMVERAPATRVDRQLGRGRHFVDLGLEWNGG